MGVNPDRPAVPQLLKPGPQNPPGAGFEYQNGGPHLLSRRLLRRLPVKPRWTMPDGCRSSRLISRRGLPTKGSLFDINEPEVEKIKTFGWLRDHKGIHCGSIGLKLKGARSGEIGRALPTRRRV
jgi:hypothetical protein